VRTLAAIAGVLLLATVLWDAFETVVLPRRVNRRLRPTQLFYRATWRPFARGAALFASVNRREAYLSLYGPLSLVLLLALWATGLITAFALLHYGTGSAVAMPSERSGLLLDFYMSGSTFFTLGLGDVAPVAWRSRAVTIVEAGMGFGFLALVIGYFPVTYQAFSARETSISLLDARAGSPPSAGELLRRHRGEGGLKALESVLHEWEHWAAELLETHLSYPMLGYFRSQHSNQSWIAALTTILDASALLITGTEGAIARQARLTFAIARHALVDLAQVFSTPPVAGADRLTAAGLARLRADLDAAGVKLAHGPEVEVRLSDLRRMYEPYAIALSRFLLQPMPEWHYETRRRDNWQSSAWDKTSAVWMDED
jgi:Ion channel